jgi:SPP1 gp7 family putative phage head morphogenesis protein
MTRDTLDKHLRRALKEAQATYRRALAAQVRGEPDAEAWDAFAEVTAALLMASWLAGARGTIDRAKVPDEAVEGMLEDGDVVEFAALPVLTEFGSKWMKPIAGWFRQRVPISRKDWELLVKAARASAGEVGDHERQNALVDLRKRSPILDGLLRGVLSRPQKGGITTVKRITNDTFFVTAMTPEQTRQTQELVARVIEERPGKSTVGKLIRSMNLGDFVTTTQALTGTELSTARLETVLRTNTNRATTEGAAEVLRDERVQAFVPLVQYSATKDPRTRPAHRAMDGYVGTIEDFDRMGLTPPCGFNCRCALIPVPAAMALDKGWTRPNGTLDYAAIKRHNGARQTVVDRGEIPDPGFVNA